MKRMLTIVLLLLFLTTIAVAETIAPSSAALYFNPNGGSYYHTNENCESVFAKFLPLTAIPDADLTAEPYEKLTPCPVCVASDAWYFNPDGGSCYHADENCGSVLAKFLPLTRIPDADLTAPPYAYLTACPTCIVEITE